MSKDRLDKLMEATFENSITGLKGLDDINIPDENYILQKFRSRINEQSFVILSHEKVPLKHKNRRVLKTLITAATMTIAILVSSLVFSIIFDTSKIKAIKLKIVHSIVQIKNDMLDITISSKNTEEATNEEITSSLPSSEIHEVESQKLSMDDLIKKVKYPVIIPGYLPDGYILKDIQLDVLPSGTNQIAQTYVTSENINLTILQSTNANDIIGEEKAPATAKVTKTNVLGIEAQIISSSASIHQVVWYNNGYSYHIIARISEIELNEFISHLKYSR